MIGVGMFWVVARRRVIGDIRMRFGRSRSPTRMGSNKVGIVINSFDLGSFKDTIQRIDIFVKHRGIRRSSMRSVSYSLELSVTLVSSSLFIWYS